MYKRKKGEKTLPCPRFSSPHSFRPGSKRSPESMQGLTGRPAGRFDRPARGKLELWPQELAGIQRFAVRPVMNRAGELGNGGWSWGSGDGGRGKPEGAVTRRVENGASARGEPLSTTTGHAPRTRTDDGRPVATYQSVPPGRV